MKNNIKLSREKREAIISAIKQYFYNERDENLGDLAAAMILDFFIDEFAAEFYNQGVQDAYRYMSDRVEDILGIQK